MTRTALLTRLALSIVLAVSLAPAAWAQTPKGAPKGAQPATPAPEPQVPAYVALPAPALQIASHPDLVVEAIEIAIGIDRVTHTYRLRNKGSQELRLAASVQLPDFSASADGSEAYRVTTNNPNNPIGLAITVDGSPVTANVKASATALGIDRTAELKAMNVPLMPFGPEADKAIAGLSPEQNAKLVTLGLLSPPDPEQPDAPIIADWTLSVTYGWEQSLAPQKTTVAAISFRPISGSFELNKETASVLDEVKDDACLSPALIKTLKSRVQGKNAATIAVTELAIANEAPVRWTSVPETMVAVNKPAPEVTVAFCGMDQKSAAATRVTGKAPDSDSSDSFRVLFFGAAAR